MNRIRLAAMMGSVLALTWGVGCGTDAERSEIESKVAEIEAADTAAERGAVTPGVPADFDIVTFGKLLRWPFIKVRGTAGGTKSAVGSNDIYAYVFVTDRGIFAVASHSFVDSDEQSGEGDVSWHAHKITLDENNCLSSIAEDGSAFLHRHFVFLLGSGAHSVSSVLTARLTLENGKACVAQVYDSMSK